MLSCKINGSLHPPSAGRSRRTFLKYPFCPARPPFPQPYARLSLCPVILKRKQGEAENLAFFISELSLRAKRSNLDFENRLYRKGLFAHCRALFGHRLISSIPGLDPSGFRACGAKFYFAILQNKWLAATSCRRMIPPNLPQIPLLPRPLLKAGGFYAELILYKEPFNPSLRVQFPEACFETFSA